MSRHPQAPNRSGIVAEPGTSTPAHAQSTRVNLRIQSKEQARERLLQAGRALLLEHGYAALSARQVSARAGVAQSSFYDHFSDKEELVRTLTESILGPLRTQLREARLDPESTSWEASLERMLLRVYAFCASEKPLVAMVFQELDQKESPLSTLSREIFAHLHQDLLEDICMLQTRGVLPAEVPQEALVSVILGSTLYTLRRMLWEEESNGLEVFAGISRLNQAMVRGMMSAVPLTA